MMIRETPRERLARHLRDNGHDVDANRITFPVGWYRINQRFDDMIVTWEVFSPVNGGTWLWSYDTITNCARRGVTLGSPEQGFIQCFAKEAIARLKKGAP